MGRINKSKKRNTRRRNVSNRRNTLKRSSKKRTFKKRTGSNRRRTVRKGRKNRTNRRIRNINRRGGMDPNSAPSQFQMNRRASEFIPGQPYIPMTQPTVQPTVQPPKDRKPWKPIGLDSGEWERKKRNYYKSGKYVPIEGPDEPMPYGLQKDILTRVIHGDTRLSREEKHEEGIKELDRLMRNTMGLINEEEDEKLKHAKEVRERTGVGSDYERFIKGFDIDDEDDMAARREIEEATAYLERKEKEKEEEVDKMTKKAYEVNELAKGLLEDEVLTPNKCDKIRTMCEMDPVYCRDVGLIDKLKECDDREELYLNMLRELPHEFYKHKLADTTDIRVGITGLPKTHFTDAVKKIIDDCLVQLNILTRHGAKYSPSGNKLLPTSRVGGIDETIRNTGWGGPTPGPGFHNSVRAILSSHLDGTREQGIRTIDDLYTLFKETMVSSNSNMLTRTNQPYDNIFFKFMELFKDTVKSRTKQTDEHIEKMIKYLILFLIGKDPHANERLYDVVAARKNREEVVRRRYAPQIDSIDRELEELSSERDKIKHLKQNKELFNKIRDKDLEIERLDDLMGDAELLWGDSVDYRQAPKLTAKTRTSRMPPVQERSRPGDITDQGWILGQPRRHAWMPSAMPLLEPEPEPEPGENDYDIRDLERRFAELQRP